MNEVLVPYSGKKAPSDGVQTTFISTDTYKLKVEKTIKGVLGRVGGEDEGKPKPPGAKAVKKVVRYVLHLDQNKMDNRKCLSEHPFGTIKRALGQYYFLLKGKQKVAAEVSLFCLSYNLRRAISLKGVPALVSSLR